MIPKIIHYCWFGGNPLPDDVKKNIDSWRKNCPDYKIIEWNESNFDVAENNYCREAYEAKKWAFVTDYVRLKVLYEYGGIYMDTDVEVVKSYNDLLYNEVFLCFEDKENVSIGTVGAVFEHPFMGELLEDYRYRHFKINGEFDLTINLKYVTSLLKRKYCLKLDGDCQKLNLGINVYSMDYFIAKSYITGEVEMTGNTYAIHHYAGSWLSDDAKKYGVIFKNNYKKLKVLPNEFVRLKMATILTRYQLGGWHAVWKCFCKVLFHFKS